MRVGTRGQVVIPVAIRRAARIREGDEVDFEYDGTAIRIVRRESRDSHGDRLVRRMRGSASAAETIGMTTADLMELLRGE